MGLGVFGGSWWVMLEGFFLLVLKERWLFCESLMKFMKY